MFDNFRENVNNGELFDSRSMNKADSVKSCSRNVLNFEFCIFLKFNRQTLNNRARVHHDRARDVKTKTC